MELIVTLVKRLANMTAAFIHGLVENASIFSSYLLKAFTGAAVSFGASSTWAKLHCLQANAILEPQRNRCFGYRKPPFRQVSTYPGKLLQCAFVPLIAIVLPASVNGGFSRCWHGRHCDGRTRVPTPP